jgi:hypothetical protein
MRNGPTNLTEGPTNLTEGPTNLTEGPTNLTEGVRRPGPYRTAIPGRRSNVIRSEIGEHTLRSLPHLAPGPQVPVPLAIALKRRSAAGSTTTGRSAVIIRVGYRLRSVGSTRFVILHQRRAPPFIRAIAVTISTGL